MDQKHTQNPETEDVGKQLTFDGFPIEFRKIGDDIILRCKNVIGLYSQIETYYKNEDPYVLTYWFGVRKKDRCEISSSMIKRGGLRIGCLTASKEEVTEVRNYCNQLLKS